MSNVPKTGYTKYMKSYWETRSSQAENGTSNAGGRLSPEDQEAIRLAKTPEARPPIVPARPVARKARRQDEQLPSPPPSPQEHRQTRGPVELDAVPRQSRMMSPPTPMHSNLSTNTASVENLQTQLEDVQVELRTLGERLDERDKEIAALSTRLNDAEDRYEQAITDITKTRKEKDDLQNQVERLQSLRAAQRNKREELQRDIDVGRARERELLRQIDEERTRERNLNEIIDRMRSCEGRPATVPITQERPSEARNERERRRNKIKIYILERKASSSVPPIFFRHSEGGKVEKKERKRRH